MTDNRITPELLWRIPRVGNPAPASDGSRCIVPVTRYDIDENHGVSRLWALHGADCDALTDDTINASQPAISPNGGTVVFAGKAAGRSAEKAQLMLVNAAGGDVRTLTDMPLGVSDPRWFSDGRRIAFVSSVHDGHFGIEETRAEAARREKAKVKAISSEDRFYRFWDRWIAGQAWPHIWCMDIETSVLSDLTPAMRRFLPLMEPAGTWAISPDGSEIALTANRTAAPYDQLISGVYLLNVNDPSAEPRLISEWTGSNAMRPRYSPDGRWIVYGAQQDDSFYSDRVRLVAYERATGRHRLLAKDWDRSPSEWEFADSLTLVLNAEDRGASALYSLGLDDDEPSQLARGGTFAGLAVAKGRAWYTAHSLRQPPEVVSLGLHEHDLRKVSSFCTPTLETLELGESREIYFESAGGAQVQAWVTFPPGVQEPKSLPTVHLIHGGPHGCFADAWQWRWCAQVFAARGWLTVMVNFHGSTGWGQEFARCIMGEWGKRPYDDIMYATDALIARGWADPDRLAAAGGSYGGYLVSWIAANSDRFKCLVNHAGVSDLQAQYARDVTPGREKALGGEPWGDIEGLDRYSPMRHSKGFKTPMLVIHGEQDYRVPYTQGLQTYNAYKAQGREARLVIYPDENHWVLKPQNSIHWYGEVTGWIERWLGT